MEQSGVDPLSVASSLLDWFAQVSEASGLVPRGAVSPYRAAAPLVGSDG